jgi:hypothetical protein
MERGNGTENTGTPAANAASRKKENTPGSQRGGRGRRDGWQAIGGRDTIAYRKLIDGTDSVTICVSRRDRLLKAARVPTFRGSNDELP